MTAIVEEDAASAAATMESIDTLSLAEQFWVKPVTGTLYPLRTRAEVVAEDETVDAYVCQVPKTFAQPLVQATRTFPNGNAAALMHIRRVIFEAQVPKTARRPPGSTTRASSQSSSSGTRSGSSVSSRSSLPTKPFKPTRKRTGPSIEPDYEDLRHVCLCPTSWVSPGELEKLIYKVAPVIASHKPVDVDIINFLNMRIVPIPKFAPTSVLQAEIYSQKYWPTIFGNSNPFGPHPSIFSGAQNLIESNLGDDDGICQAKLFLGFAREAARQTQAKGSQEPIGITIVERNPITFAVEIVAVAGDVRDSSCHSKGSGNPGSHAVMRAIAMVAAKRRRVAVLRPGQELASYPNSIFSEHCRTDIESEVFKVENIIPNGYLCLNLEAYITHEPCVMCSMALVHSRFGRVVFAGGAIASGGLHVEPTHSLLRARSEDIESSLRPVKLLPSSLGYGLWWRDDLNWRFLCWQYLDDDCKKVGRGEHCHHQMRLTNDLMISV